MFKKKVDCPKANRERAEFKIMPTVPQMALEHADILVWIGDNWAWYGNGGKLETMDK